MKKIIPDFDHNKVLPPYLNSPVEKEMQSPYKCSILEFVQRFGTTKDRVSLLRKYIQFRKKLREYNIIGFQWIGGSFLTDKESMVIRDKDNCQSLNQSPSDIDVVTFFYGVNENQIQIILNDFIEFVDPKIAKKNFCLDHYIVQIDNNPKYVVDAVRYWNNLFSHDRNNVWKGMLEVQIDCLEDDIKALNYLESLSL